MRVADLSERNRLLSVVIKNESKVLWIARTGFYEHG